MSTAKETLVQQLDALNNAINNKAGISGKHTIADMTSNVEAIATEKPEQTKNVTLDLSEGSQEVTPDSGKVLTSITIQKPNELTAANVRSGVTIAGVSGTLEEQKPEQVKSVALNMANGDQVVSPDNGKVLTQVTVEKPNTLIAENIKDGVTIGGVTGILEEAKTEYSESVELDFSEGDMYIYPESGSVFNEIRIPEPTNLESENIKDGVTIAGITGSYEGGGSFEPENYYHCNSSGYMILQHFSNGSYYQMRGGYLEKPWFGKNNIYYGEDESGWGLILADLSTGGVYQYDQSAENNPFIPDRDFMSFDELYYLGAGSEGIMPLQLYNLDVGDSVSFTPRNSPYDRHNYIVIREPDSD